jgi:hypothetical protein
MGGTPHWRGGHLAWLSAAAKISVAKRERCAAIVGRWNAAPTHDWSPTIGSALKACYRWVDVYCGRRQNQRHADFGIAEELEFQRRRIRGCSAGIDARPFLKRGGRS